MHFMKKLFKGLELYAAPAKANSCEIYAMIYSLMSCRVETFFDVFKFIQIYANMQNMQTIEFYFKILSKLSSTLAYVNIVLQSESFRVGLSAAFNTGTV